VSEETVTVTVAVVTIVRIASTIDVQCARLVSVAVMPSDVQIDAATVAAGVMAMSGQSKGQGSAGNGSAENPTEGIEGKVRGGRSGDATVGRLRLASKLGIGIADSENPGDGIDGNPISGRSGRVKDGRESEGSNPGIGIDKLRKPGDGIEGSAMIGSSGRDREGKSHTTQ
jgi:hypothetical protein